MDKITGLSITMPGNPYLDLNLTSRLFAFEKTFLAFRRNFNFSGQYLSHMLIRNPAK